MLTERQLIADGFMSVSEAAKYLGIGKRTMYDLIRAGVITHARRGHSVRVSIAAVHAYAKLILVRGSVA